MLPMVDFIKVERTAQIIDIGLLLYEIDPLMARKDLYYVSTSQARTLHTSSSVKTA